MFLIMQETPNILSHRLHLLYVTDITVKKGSILFFLSTFI